MTNQELFDECVSHVLKQGDCAYGDKGCQYLTKDGKSCAIGGPLVARGLYSPVMENAAVTTELDVADVFDNFNYSAATLLEALTYWGVEEHQLSLLSSLQAAHDEPARNNIDPEKRMKAFKENVRDIARRHNLNVKVLQQ